MKKNKRTLGIAIIGATLFFLAFMVGCIKDDYVENVGICPIVASTNPTNGAVGVPIDQIVTITFNEKMNAETISPSSFSLHATGSTKGSEIDVPGNFSYNVDSFTISFVPNSVLTSNTVYTGRLISESIKDLSGNSLQANYEWSFSTGSTVAPKVTGTDPVSNALEVPLNKIISATFSEPMDLLSFTSGTFTLKKGENLVVGTVSYSNNVATFEPSDALLVNTIYTATITTGVKNKAGTILAKNYVWLFTTKDVAAPKVVSIDPINNATGVALNKSINAIFSEEMNSLTLNATTFIIKQGETQVVGTISYTGNTVSFEPLGGLTSGNTYTVTLTTGVKNTFGTPLANNYIWSFNTGKPLGPLVVDLKTVARFGIIAGVGIRNDAGFSIINNMDVGISPGVRTSVTGFPPAVMVNGEIYASDDIAPLGVAAMLTQAKLDLTAAYLFAEGAVSPAPATVSGDIGGTTLAPGIYKSTSTLLIQSGDLTLDAGGDENAVWIFQVASAFTTIGGAGGDIILTGRAQAKNIFWQTGSSATIGDGTSFYGNILALTSITMNSGAVATGRMLARNGSVVMTSTNIINKP